jgi:hypothetical protein
VNQTITQRTFALTRHMLAEHMQFNLILWAGFVAFVGVIIVGAAIFRGITVSGWEQGATQVPRWWVLFVGVHLGYTVLALHVAHGQTRRAFAQQAALFMLGFAAFGALLIAVGFALEGALYALAGWPQALSLSHLFTSPWQLHLVFTEFWLRFMVWGAAGLMLGAAFYREPGLGGILIPPAILLIAVGEIPMAPGNWWPFGDLPFFLDFGLTSVLLLVGIFMPLLSLAIISAIAWSVVKDIPLRNKGM